MSAAALQNGEKPTEAELRRLLRENGVTTPVSIEVWRLMHTAFLLGKYAGVMQRELDTTA